MPTAASCRAFLTLEPEGVSAEPPLRSFVVARRSPLRVRASDRRGSRLRRLGDPVTLQTLRAHPDPLGRALDQHPYRLQIRVPAALCAIVGVADIVAGDRPLAAHGANPSHKLLPSSETDGRTVSGQTVGRVRKILNSGRRPDRRKARKPNGRLPMNQPRTAAHA